MTETELFDRMAECAVAGTWDLLTLEELERLEAAAKRDGEDDLWIEVKGKPLRIRDEINRRRARNELKGDGPPPEL